MKLLVLLLFSISVLFMASQEQTEPQSFYGDFFAPSNNLSLDLLPPNRFELSKLSFFEDLITGEPISEGTYELSNSKITLFESNSSRTFALSVKNPEILIPEQLVESDSTNWFLAWTKYHNNGEKFSNGGWQNRKKYGTWHYWNEQGLMTHEVEYDTITGIAIDTVFMDNNK
jgi:hypothetical protein